MGEEAEQRRREMHVTILINAGEQRLLRCWNGAQNLILCIFGKTNSLVVVLDE